MNLVYFHKTDYRNLQKSFRNKYKYTSAYNIEDHLIKSDKEEIFEKKND